jgi:hypothetical protein
VAVCHCPPTSADLAVILAVNDGTGDFDPKVQGSTPCATTILVVLMRLKHDKSARLMFVVVSADALQVSRLMLDTPAHEGDEPG